MAIGDHIYTERLNGIYSHHGIDCGNGMVIHYTAPRWRDRRQISRTTIEEFAKEGEILVKDYESFFDALRQPGSYSKKANHHISQMFNKLKGIDVDQLDLSSEAVIQRAEARLGEKAFNIVIHNCEHFATWCKTGINNSDQINAILKQTMTTPEFARHRTNDLMLKIFEPKWPGID